MGNLGFRTETYRNHLIKDMESHEFPLAASASRQAAAIISADSEPFSAPPDASSQDRGRSASCLRETWRIHIRPGGSSHLKELAGLEGLEMKKPDFMDRSLWHFSTLFPCSTSYTWIFQL